MRSDEWLQFRQKYRTAENYAVKTVKHAVNHGVGIEPVEEVGEMINPADYRLRDFTLSGISPLIGRTPAQARLRERYSTMIVAVKRGDEWIENPGSTVFQAGDKLWAVTTAATVRHLK